MMKINLNPQIHHSLSFPDPLFETPNSLFYYLSSLILLVGIIFKKQEHSLWTDVLISRAWTSAPATTWTSSTQEHSARITRKSTTPTSPNARWWNLLDCTRKGKKCSRTIRSASKKDTWMNIKLSLKENWKNWWNTLEANRISKNKPPKSSSINLLSSNYHFKVTSTSSTMENKPSWTNSANTTNSNSS